MMNRTKEIELIVDLHRNSERQGPGSIEDTLKALGFMNLPLHHNVRIADLGCGTGGQTITLAQHLNCHIVAVDLFPEFLDELNERADLLGFGEKISTQEKSIDALTFEKEELDIIWSEGAIYNIGFENGIRQWKDYLKIGGYIAISEITWISEARPKEIEEYWEREYPEIDTASNKIQILEKNGYTLCGYFFLSENSWIENYYEPMKARFESFLERHNQSALSRKLVDDHRAEIHLYQKYKDYFSYGFYIARKSR